MSKPPREQIDWAVRTGFRIFAVGMLVVAYGAGYQRDPIAYAGAIALALWAFSDAKRI